MLSVCGIVTPRKLANKVLLAICLSLLVHWTHLGRHAPQSLKNGYSKRKTSGHLWWPPVLKNPKTNPKRSGHLTGPFTELESLSHAVLRIKHWDRQRKLYVGQAFSPAPFVVK